MEWTFALVHRFAAEENQFGELHCQHIVNELDLDQGYHTLLPLHPLSTNHRGLQGV